MAALSQPLVYKKEFFLQQTSRGCKPQVGRSGPCKKKCEVAHLRCRAAVAPRRGWEGGGVEVVQAGEAPETGLSFPPVTAGAGLINAESKVSY